MSDSSFTRNYGPSHCESSSLSVRNKNSIWSHTGNVPYCRPRNYPHGNDACGWMTASWTILNDHKANMPHSPNVGAMLGQRRRRSASIKPALSLVSFGPHSACWASLWSGRHSLVMIFWQISWSCLAGSFLVVLFPNSDSFPSDWVRTLVTHSHQKWEAYMNACTAESILFQISFKRKEMARKFINMPM